jgi:hypothetical protein
MRGWAALALGAAVAAMVWIGDGAAGWAAAPPCPKPPQIQLPTPVSLNVYNPVVVFRHDVDLLGLPRVEGHMETPPAGWVLQGLTLTADHLDIRTRWVRQDLSDGRVCIWLASVAATLGIPEQHVYVANDYPEGSCEYRAVVTHEYKHVEINRRVVNSYGEPVLKALRAGVAQTNPLIFSNRNVQDSQVTGFLYTLMRPTVAAMTAELRRQNGAIDTPQAYIQEHAASGCKNWFPRGLPGYAHHGAPPPG